MWLFCFWRFWCMLHFLLQSSFREYTARSTETVQSSSEKTVLGMGRRRHLRGRIVCSLDAWTSHEQNSHDGDWNYDAEPPTAKLLSVARTLPCRVTYGAQTCGNFNAFSGGGSALIPCYGKNTILKSDLVAKGINYSNA